MCYVGTHGYFGAVIANDTKEDGDYIVKFYSFPYTLQEDVMIEGISLSMSEQVSSACYIS